MNFETLNHHVADGILTITLNRPERLNAFVLRMGEELIQAFNDASEDDAIRAIVVTGAGRAFCAGMDLNTEGNAFGINETLTPTLADLDARLNDPEIEHGIRDAGGSVTLAIFDCKKPVIAAVNGVAVGFGATMLLAMDIRLASEHARFGFVFGRLGIVPEACSSWFCPRWSASPRRWNGLTRPSSSRRRRRCAAIWSARSSRRKCCWSGPMHWLGPSPTNAPPEKSRNPAHNFVSIPAFGSMDKPQEM